jgi:hypothetical protein
VFEDVQVPKWYPLVTPFELSDALFWDRRRPRLPLSAMEILVATNAGVLACPFQLSRS